MKICAKCEGVIMEILYDTECHNCKAAYCKDCQNHIFNCSSCGTEICDLCADGDICKICAEIEAESEV